jgi:hypothetical protein
MVIEGHDHGRRGYHQQKNKAEMDKEIEEIRAKMDRLALKMQQEAQVHWRYEWPMKQKFRWHVQKLLARRKQQVLIRCL